MKVLLTGGAGYIGSHTAVVLLQAGHKVTILDNFSNSKPDVLSRIERIAGKPISVVIGDIRDAAVVASTLRAHNCEAVVHLAGLKAVGESVGQPLDYYAHNVQGSISLLQAMKDERVNTLVFSSSATVYGQPRYLPLDEAHPTSAANPYGRCKLYVEEMLRDLCAADHQLRVLCLRYFNPVGAHASGLIGDDPRGLPNNLMPYLSRVAMGELPCLSVFGNDYETMDGTGVRDYIHVDDLANGHLVALSYLGTHRGFDAINLGTGQGYSVLQMVEAFAEVSGRQIPYILAPRRAGDVAACYASPDKAARLLGWRARRTLQDMCRDAWRWQIQRACVQSQEFSA